MTNTTYLAFDNEIKHLAYSMLMWYKQCILSSRMLRCNDV